MIASTCGTDVKGKKIFWYVKIFFMRRSVCVEMRARESSAWLTAIGMDVWLPLVCSAKLCSNDALSSAAAELKSILTLVPRANSMSWLLTDVSACTGRRVATKRKIQNLTYPINCWRREWVFFSKISVWVWTRSGERWTLPTLWLTASRTEKWRRTWGQLVVFREG